MADNSPPDPGGGNDYAKGAGSTYSDKLKANVNYNQRLKRNVLEISLEKTEEEADLHVGNDCLERVMKSIGIDMNLVMGFQTKFRGKFCNFKCLV